MHELSITEELLQIIHRRAAEEGMKKILRIDLKIGKYSGVFADALLFAFDVLSKDTISEGANVSIEESVGSELQVISFEGD